MNYDCIIKIVGRNKSFFILSLCIVSFVTYTTNIHKHSLSVALFQPRFNCRIPTYLLSKSNSENISAYISWDQCMYKQFENDTFQFCNEHNFDRKQFRATFVTEFNLVCQRVFIKQILYYLELVNIPLILLFGFLADKIGRKIVTMGLLIIHTIFQIAIGLINNMWVNVVLMSLSNIASITELIGLVWVLELNHSSLEAIIFSIYFIFGVLSSFIISMVSYFSMNWRLVYLISAATMIFWFTLLFIPESPRWFLVKNKHKKFFDTMNFISKFDSTEIPTNLIEDFIEYSEWIDISRFSICDLCYYSNLRYRLIALVFMSFSINLFPPNFIINISPLHGSNFSLAFLKASSIFMLFLIPLWMILLINKKLVKPLIAMTSSAILLYTICIFFNSVFYSHRLLKLIFEYTAQNLIHSIMIVLYLFVINLMPTTHRCLSLACVAVSAILGKLVSSFFMYLIGFMKRKMNDDIYITVITYFFINIISLIWFFYQTPEAGKFPYPQVSSDATRLEKGIEDELRQEIAEHNLNFNRKYESSYLFRK